MKNPLGVTWLLGRHLIIAALILIAGCAASPSEAVIGKCPAPLVRSAEYLIGPGDRLQIVVWRNEELSATVPVRPDGKISTPLVDDMIAIGRSPTQLAEEMESVLGEYLRSPEVSVIVVSQGAANQIQVLGEVTVPQSVPSREGIRLLDAVVAVGGLSEFAAGNRANLVRQVESGQVKCRVLLDDLLSGDMSQNIELYPGDVLVVPETRF